MLKSILTRSTLLLLLTLFVGSQFAEAQKRVTLKDLNSYETLQELADIGKHPLRDTVVTFTAILNSYPKNSGLASYNATSGAIGRVHVFVTDTTAASLGRDGMAMQIVQDASTATFSVVEGLSPASIVDVTGRLTFFNATVGGVSLPLNAQFTVTEIEDVTNKVQTAVGDLTRYYDLLAPISINPNDLNEVNGAGKVQMKLDAYPKYAHAYVKFENTTVQFTQGAIARPNYAVRTGNDPALVYSNDISLRYRNDRTAYRDGYNRRQGDDGLFTPPPAGALINLSGFLGLNNFDVFESIEPSSIIFKVAPFDDGIVWIDGVRNVNGENDFTWPNDLTIVGFPPTFENFAINSLTPKPNVENSFSVTILPSGENTTITGVEMTWTKNDTTQTPVTLTPTDNTYNHTFPGMKDKDVVTFRINATDSEGLVGSYGPITFITVNTITSIEEIQRTPDNVQGASPYRGQGVLAMDIDATVMADSLDGFVVVHSSADAWSGIFLDSRDNAAVRGLRKGDVINITSGEVFEDFDVTYLSKVVLTKTGENSNYMDLVPTKLTQDITGSNNRGEAWEGMLIKFEDVKVLTNNADGGSDFGEWAFGSRQSETEGLDTLAANQGLRVDDSNTSGTGNLIVNTGVNNFPNFINENVKIGAVAEALYGVLVQSFSNPKLKMRNTTDIIAEDWTNPTRNIALVTPANNSEYNVSSTTEDTIEAEWTASTEFDGNDVKYMFVLTTADESETFLVDADDEGSANTLSIPLSEIDAVMQELEIAENVKTNFKWTVWITDGVDTVQTSTYSAATFTPVWYNIAFTRGSVSVDENETKNFTFELTQNYPNPFNPSTVINYSIPVASKVELSVYNVLGQKVATLVNAQQAAGKFNVQFNASALSSGMYFYRLEAGNRVEVKKMLLIK